jgi:electron transport complex protein RnfB
MSWATALLAVALLSGIAGLLLGVASQICQTTTDPLVASIDACLPQIQCGQCGYPGCLPYATAVAQGEAINQCVPGGQAVLLQLAELLHREPPVASPLADPLPLTIPIKQVAWIDEAFCIGCTKCLQVCPVDAIIGSAKVMHTVLTDYCTGCDLCVAPCPTQCIELLPLDQLLMKWPLPPPSEAAVEPPSLSTV